MNIDIKEVLRYLGHKNQVIGESTKELVKECVEETRKIAKSNYIYSYYDIDKKDNFVSLLNTNVVLMGKDICAHLEYSNKCVVMAVTLGNEVEYKIRYYEKTNLTKALIMDACATVAVEELCDEVEEKIKEEVLKMGLGITYRYSPGYGDLPIELQPKILNLLEAQKRIGLTVSDNFILLPRKSVTAIIGIQGLEHKRLHPGCRVCRNNKYCHFRKEGDYCGA